MKILTHFYEVPCTCALSKNNTSFQQENLSPRPQHQPKYAFTNKQARVCKSHVLSGQQSKHNEASSIGLVMHVLALQQKKTDFFCWNTRPWAPTAAKLIDYEQTSKEARGSK